MCGISLSFPFPGAGVSESWILVIGMARPFVLLQAKPFHTRYWVGIICLFLGQKMLAASFLRGYSILGLFSHLFLLLSGLSMLLSLASSILALT